jgi:hypothetical protein
MEMEVAPNTKIKTTTGTNPHLTRQMVGEVKTLLIRETDDDYIYTDYTCEYNIIPFLLSNFLFISR